MICARRGKLQLSAAIAVFLVGIACAHAGWAQKTGVLKRTEKASPGYTLLAPLGSTETQLIDLDGNVVHRWPSETRPGLAAYLLDDGSLLRACKIPGEPEFPMSGGAGGRVQRISWDGDLLWDFTYASKNYVQHHDIEPMPNGNVLLIAWEVKTKQEAIAAGRDPEAIDADRRRGGTVPSLWPETIVEVTPNGKTGGEIVWKWCLWDHLVQDFDKSKGNYGLPRDHPELVDLNLMRNPNPDWIHMNSVAYNQSLDQILLSARWFNEVWIIDHGTTTEEAASHSGGKYGKGGDLLYRWGNPFAYFAGFPDDQLLFAQHDAHWIPEGLPGAGSIMVFNNGDRRLGRAFSTVDEWKPDINPDGSYTCSTGGCFGPLDFAWSYRGDFHSERISGAQRMPNGNTLICSGSEGHLLEVTTDGEVVWEFRMPRSSVPEGEPAFRGFRGFPAAARQPSRLRFGRPGPSNDGGLQRVGRRAPPGPDGGGGGLFRAPRFAPDHPAFAGKDLAAHAE